LFKQQKEHDKTVKQIKQNVKKSVFLSLFKDVLFLLHFLEGNLVN